VATTLRVNGREHTVDVDPATPLIFVLRNDLGLFGTKLGCGVEQCGACTVLVDGEPAFACTLAIDAIAGREVTTVEGLGSPAAPHRLQEAFLAENAAQCGWCTAGFIVRAAALVERQPLATDTDIRAALAQNLCRCGAHPRVLRAVRRVLDGDRG
jgi:aerobic-type carbon monoxide dehydrogenase small subunit (CoxS/CutS family)